MRDRRAVFLMSLASFVLTFAGGMLSYTEPFARDSMDLSRGGMLWVFSAVRAASLIGVLFAVVADRVGRRRPFLLAFLLIPVGNLVTAFVPGVVPFTIGQSVTRIGIVAAAVLTTVILAEELSPQIRAFGLGIHAIAASLGGGLGLILLPIAERGEESWRLLFGLTGIGLILLPLLVRFLKESRAFVRYRSRITFRRALAAGLGKHFWPLAVMGFFIAMFASPTLDLALERLIVDLEWDASAARFLVIVFAGLGSLGLLVGGRLADRVGRRETTMLALILGLIGGVGFYNVTIGWLLAPAVFFATFGASMLTPSLAAHRAELFPTRVRAMAGGWLTNIAIAGSAAGFAIGAFVVETVGLSLTMSLLGIGLVIAMILVFRLPETRGLDVVREARHGTTTQAQRPGRPSAPRAPTTPR
ncbi:MAG: MFS transporter [Acidimicrobiia bacterium]